jgi:uncharacterized integral membrane protein
MTLRDGGKAMLRKIVNGLILIPLAVILIVFAVANREWVSVSLDPFNKTDPALSFSLPLFVLLILVAILGVVVGGTATWSRQRPWRRAARQHEAELRRLRMELAARVEQESRAADDFAAPKVPRRLPPAA